MTGAMLVAARSSDSTAHNIILKLRTPAGVNGHFGPTSLACELIFSIIARQLGLAVPDYAIAEVGPIFANGIGNATVSDVMVRNVGLNYGSVILESYHTWDPGCVSRSDALRSAVSEVLNFDATIVNGDRQSRNPNLLWNGLDSVQMIDHSLACPAHQWDAATIASSPLVPDSHVQAHAGYTFLRRRGSSFDEVGQRWDREMTDLFWADLRAVIPPEWETNPGDLDRIFDFLTARKAKSGEIGADLRRIVQ